MQVLIVVDDPKDMPLGFVGVEIVPAKGYLTEARYAGMRWAKVYNLCRSYKYQGLGYYVSLLAAARGHKPVPSVTTIQDLKSPAFVRAAVEEFDGLIQKSLAPIHSGEFILSIYFGRNLARRHDNLSSRLFRSFQAPLMRAHFEHRTKTGKWYLKSVSPVTVKEIPAEHRDFVVDVAHEFFKKRNTNWARKAASRYDLAILQNPDEKEPPSDPRALARFIKAAESAGLSAELIDKNDSGRLGEFDALFIRETTDVQHHTYRLARKAASEGLVVVDDPESILKCSNKVFLAEIMTRYKVPIPKTVIVHRDNAAGLAGLLGLPCVLKRPDSSFSAGVVKAETESELKHMVEGFLEDSELVIAQEFIYTPFDWRVGVFDRQVAFVCKYFMPRKHWQIIKRDAAGGNIEYGNFESIAVEDAPPELLKIALRASNLIGDGLYGVDVKQVGKKFYVIEVNDNPNINSGVEDKILKGELYDRFMATFVKRIEKLKERKSPA